MIAIGEAADQVADTFRGVVPTTIVDSIDDAVRRRSRRRRPATRSSWAPACASWDQFTDYAERGDRFAAAARSLREEAGARG